MSDDAQVQTTPRTKILKNGAVYDLDKGRIVANPGGGTQAITSANARDMLERRRELKYQRAQAGANRALEALRNKKWNDGTKRWDDDGPAWENPNDLDFVEAITEAQAAQALMVGDPSSTKAAEFVMSNTGLGEKQIQQAAPQDAAPVTQALIMLLDAVTRRLSQEPVIDVIPERVEDEY